MRKLLGFRRGWTHRVSVLSRLKAIGKGAVKMNDLNYQRIQVRSATLRWRKKGKLR